MDSHSQCLNVVASVGPTSKVRQVELNLVPSLVQPHGHSADKGLDSGGRLVVGCPEPPPYILVV